MTFRRQLLVELAFVLETLGILTFYPLPLVLLGSVESFQEQDCWLWLIFGDLSWASVSLPFCLLVLFVFFLLGSYSLSSATTVSSLVSPEENNLRAFTSTVSGYKQLNILKSDSSYCKDWIFVVFVFRSLVWLHYITLFLFELSCMVSSTPLPFNPCQHIQMIFSLQKQSPTLSRQGWATVVFHGSDNCICLLGSSLTYGICGFRVELPRYEYYPHLLGLWPSKSFP